MCEQAYVLMRGDEYYLSTGLPFCTYSRLYAELVRKDYAPEYGVVALREGGWIPIYGQREPEWKDRLLGYSPTYTIGRRGCLVCCGAMAVSGAYGEDITPVMFNERLKEVGGFVPGTADMYFGKVAEAYPKLKLSGLFRYPYPQNADLSKIDEGLEKGQYVIVQVDMDPRDIDVDQHWVLVKQKIRDGVYLICDPWPGDQLELPPAYCRAGWRAEHAIFSIVRYGGN